MPTTSSVTVSALALVLACSAGLAQNIILVNDDAASGGDGSSWSNALRSLDDALALAKENDQIWVAEGSYQPKSTGDETSTFVIPNRVSVYGGFKGVETDLAERGDPFEYASILDGEVTGGPGNIDHLVFILGLDSCRVDGFVIQNAYAQSSAANPNGAGILCANSSAEFANLAFQDCTSESLGGAMVIYGDGSVTITDSSFQSCTSDYGGAIYASKPIVIDGCDFDSNTATYRGGAVYMTGQGISEIADSRFEDNHAGDGGGAISSALIHVDTTTAMLVTECDFETNMTDNAGGDGGAIALYNDGQHEVRGCRFFGNYAREYGGAILSGVTAGNSTLIENCLMSGNIAVTRGAGVYDGNGGTCSLVNSTVMGNDSGDLGAGFFTNAGDVVVANTLFWDNNNINSAGQPRQDQFSFNAGPTRLLSINHSIMQNWTTSASFTVVSTSGDDPRFTNATGGDGIYGTPDDNPAIDAGSPAIDAGNSLYVSPLSFSDVAGNARFHDDTGTADTGVDDGVNPVVDIGAAEFQGTTVPCFADCDDNGSLNVDDIDCYVAAFFASDLTLADCDGNGSLNVDDIDCFVASFLGGCP